MAAKYIFPQDVEAATVRIQSLPEANKAEYAKYLESRVFDILNVIRPWGINGETAKWLLTDSLVEEEMEKGFPAPHPADVEQILTSCWKLEHVQRAQRDDEIESLKVADIDRKPIKLFSTCPNGLYNEIRTFTDFGAGIDVLSEVAAIKRAGGFPIDNLLKDACTEHINKKCPTLKRATPEISVVNMIQERQQATYRRFNEEEPVGQDRWDWLKDKQDSLRRNDAVDALLKNLFLDGEKPLESAEGPEVSFGIRRTRNTSISSVSSSSSRQASSARETGSEGNSTTVDKGKGTVAPPLKRPLTSVSARPAKMSAARRVKLL